MKNKSKNKKETPPTPSSGSQETKGETKLLVEEVLGVPQHVDEEKGILYDCLLLGETSRNGVRYLYETRQDALSLFEGAKVNLSHPKRGPDAIKESYTWDRRYGKAFEVRNTPEGIRGNVKVLKSHNFTKTLFEAAAHMPDMFGFSPVMVGVCTPRDNQGLETCVKIKKVRCIDIVTDPGTTKSLFEDLNMTDYQVTKEINTALTSPASGSETETKPEERELKEEEAAEAARAAEESEEETEAIEEHGGPGAVLMHAILDEIEAYLDEHHDHERTHHRIGQHLKHHHKMHMSEGAGAEESEEEKEAEEEARWYGPSHTQTNPKKVRGKEKVITEEKAPKYQVTKVKSGVQIPLTSPLNQEEEKRDWMAVLRK